MVLMYRQIHLLSALFNEIQQKMILPVMMQGTSLVLAFSLAMLVILPVSNDLLMIEFVLGSCSFHSILFYLSCLGGMVTVQKRFNTALRKFKQKTCIPIDKNERKWIRVLGRSFFPVKIKFGVNNFIEALTPLKCLLCIMRFTVQILLLKRGGKT